MTLCDAFLFYLSIRARAWERMQNPVTFRHPSPGRRRTDDRPGRHPPGGRQRTHRSTRRAQVRGSPRGRAVAGTCGRAGCRVRGYTWSERPNAWEVWTEQCANCHLWFEVDTLPPNKRVKSGRVSWCRGCHLERNRRWREENQEYVAEYNKSRREGPFPKDCVVCVLATTRTS